MPKIILRGECKFQPPADVAGVFFLYPFDMRTIRVLIVDDLPKVREGLSAVLTLAGSASEPRIEIAGEACNGNEAVQQARNLQPDVVLMDLKMPGLDGCAATQRIKAALPNVRVIILSIHSDAKEKQRARAAGADGYVEKGARLNELLLAVLNNPDATTPNNQQEGEKT